MSNEPVAGRSRSHEARGAVALSLAVLFVAVMARGVTFFDYGISWDEGFRLRAGEAALNYYDQVFAGERDFGDLGEDLRTSLYPGLFDMSAMAWTRVLGTDPYLTSHAWVQLWGLSALVAVWLIGWRLYGPWCGLACMVFLATAPRFWGHTAFNPKDIPFLTGYAWSLWWLLFAAWPLPRLVLWRWLLAGLSFGLCAGTRVAGMVFVGYAALVMGGSLFWRLWSLRAWTEPGWWRPWSRCLLRHLGVGLALAGTTILVLMPVYPAMHASLAEAQTGVKEQLGHLVEASKGPAWVGRVLFEGRQIEAAELPWYYLPKWLLIAVPEGLYLALVAGLFVALSWVRRHWRQPREHAWRAGPLLLILFSFAFPLVIAILRDQLFYDGLRHALFLHVPLACLAGIGLYATLVRLRGWRPRAARWALAVALLTFAWNLFHMVSLHPYQYVYFNAFVGHLPGADGLYEKDYWGLSLKEAIEGLEAEYARSSKSMAVASMRPEFLTEYYLMSSPLQYVPEGVSSGADYVVVLDRWEQPAEAFRFLEPDHHLTVRRQGVVLCWVFAPMHRQEE